MDFVTVSDAARRITQDTGKTVSPQSISTLLYRRILDDSRCPIVGRNRMIPVDYLPEVQRALSSVGTRHKREVVPC